MSIFKKIAEKRREMQEELRSWRNTHDCFLIWGEYPGGWQIVKDAILCIFLLNLLIGELKQIDLAEYLTPKEWVFVQETRIQPVKAAMASIEDKAPETADSATTEALVDYIFMKESTRGKNNYSKCEAVGKYNRYGFGIPGNGKYLCFEKDQDTVAVTGWVAQKKAQGFDNASVLCYYNTGVNTNKCPYYEGFEKLAR